MLEFLMSEGSAAVGRLFALLVGPGLMMIFAAAIFQNGDGVFHGKSIAYWTIFSGVVAGRILEFRGGHPQTSTGEPAEPHHLREFLVRGTVVALAVWAAAFFLRQR
jgi:hypothetical protein